MEYFWKKFRIKTRTLPLSCGHAGLLTWKRYHSYTTPIPSIIFIVIDQVTTRQLLLHLNLLWLVHLGESNFIVPFGSYHLAGIAANSSGNVYRKGFFQPACLEKMKYMNISYRENSPFRPSNSYFENPDLIILEECVQALLFHAKSLKSLKLSMLGFHSPSSLEDPTLSLREPLIQLFEDRLTSFTFLAYTHEWCMDELFGRMFPAASMGKTRRGEWPRELYQTWSYLPILWSGLESHESRQWRRVPEDMKYRAIWEYKATKPTWGLFWTDEGIFCRD